jgi:hypothetical protein
MNQLPPTGDTVEVHDGRFYIEGNEVTEDEARAAGGEPTAEAPSDAPSGPQTGSEATEGVEEPPNVMERLRKDYKSGQGDRRKVIEIAPAQYRDFAAEFRPIDYDLRRKLTRQANRRGETGAEADMKINAALMADACVSIVYRIKPGADWTPLHTCIEKYRGGAPIRFDTKLADVLGIELVGGESEGDICRLVFGDPQVFEPHFIALNGWSTKTWDVEGAEDDEDEEGGDRPT